MLRLLEDPNARRGSSKAWQLTCFSRRGIGMDRSGGIHQQWILEWRHVVKAEPRKHALPFKMVEDGLCGFKTDGWRLMCQSVALENGRTSTTPNKAPYASPFNTLLLPLVSNRAQDVKFLVVFALVLVL